MALGKPHPEQLGVTYVYAEWGFMVIPGMGFPDLRISFFHEASPTIVHDTLATIVTIIRGEEPHSPLT